MPLFNGTLYWICVGIGVCDVMCIETGCDYRASSSEPVASMEDNS